MNSPTVQMDNIDTLPSTAQDYPEKPIEVTVVPPLKQKCVRVAWVCSWTSPEALLNHLVYFSENGKAANWRDMITVPLTDPDLDFIIVLDGYTTVLPPRRRVFVQREPTAITALPDLQQYASVVTLQSTGYHAATPWVLQPLPQLLTQPWPVKTKTLVTVCSGKCATPAQQQRLQFLKELCRHVDIDVYGRGLDPADFHGCYRGYTTGKDKSELLQPYRFALAVENSSEPGYFTEKIVDPLLLHTIPIYWGCPNVTDFLPAASLHTVDIYDIPAAVQHIKHIVEQPISLQTQLAVHTARYKILTRYNVWPTVYAAVQSVSSDEVVAPRAKMGIFNPWTQQSAPSV